MDPIALKRLQTQVEQLSRDTGRWMADQRVSADQIDTKTPGNLVSFVDRESERRLVEGLGKLLPESGFIAEEGTGTPGPTLNWIIDPLDGTTNYLHELPAYATSVALHDGQELLLGVVFNPATDELFSAAKGQGCTLNGQPIHVSTTPALPDTLLATGFPFDEFHFEPEYMQAFRAFCKCTRGQRRFGSAALDLAYVAAGRYGGYWEYSLHSWDVAAGILLVREAGGTVTAFDQAADPVKGQSIVASNTALHPAMVEVLQSAFSALPS
ncbi:MAG: inositol monophosphatase family protein [Flavobacteriales bacterium]